MKSKLILAFYLVTVSVSAQNIYQYKLDLVTVIKDQVKVSLVPPKTDKTELLFIIPRAVQGSYSVKNYGRFITKFTAYDNAGKKLKTKQKEFNKFYIYSTQTLARIEYLVDDTWDTKNKKNFVFQPGGSNIEAGLNYAVNTFCFFGYFDGYKMNPFQIEVTKPEQMYGSGFLKPRIFEVTIPNNSLSAQVNVIIGFLLLSVRVATVISFGNSKVTLCE